MNGGYVMFDASVLDLDNGGTLEGLYNKMQELFESGKPLMICNFAVSTLTIKASMSDLVYDNDSDGFIIKIGFGVITITNANVYAYSEE